MIKEIAAATLGLAAIVAASPASADYVVYTNRATFEAAIKGESTETFDQLGLPSQSFGATGLSQMSGLNLPVTITGSNNYLFSTSASQLAGFYGANKTFLLGPTSSTAKDGITVSNLPINTYNAAGADVATYASNSMVSFVAKTSKGEELTGSVNVDGTSTAAISGFLGVVTTTPNDYVTSLTFLAPVGANQGVVVDNLSFGISPAAVPEPGTMALLLTGSLVIGAGALRRGRPGAMDA